MRVLISVSDKRGVAGFARRLAEMGAEIISTGGTHKLLEEEGIPVTGISEVTGFPECLDGRVKTLHPAVHGGILAMRDKEEHMEQLKKLNIQTIDIVAINLYPFRETIRKQEVTLEDAIENIDIGGPAMLRSSAKNHRDVVVICDPSDYGPVLEELIEKGGVSYATKYRLALKVFDHTAAYDAMIAEYLRKEGARVLGKTEEDLPETLTLTFEKAQELRYGENPHQKAAYYKEVRPYEGSLARAVQLHGKELSFNNINDANGALEALKEFEEPAVVAVKHANPCGAAVGENIYEAYGTAYDADPVSIFGGIIAANRTIDRETAEEIHKIFVEIVIAPDFTEEALAVLRQKANIRLLELPSIGQTPPEGELDLKKVSGGLLVHNRDDLLFQEELQVVTKRQPTPDEMEQLKLAMKVVKHVKSNGIVIARDNRTLGIGPGQVNRIWAVENAIRQATGDLQGAVMASDAFFPFDDCVAAAGAAGITAVIHPGGSLKDQDSIDKADELGMAMVITGVRHFKH